MHHPRERKPAYDEPEPNAAQVDKHVPDPLARAKQTELLENKLTPPLAIFFASAHNIRNLFHSHTIIY